MKKKYLILLVIFIFCLSLAVRYWPIYHKGFSWSISADNLILARNLSITGKFSLGNEKDVILSSELIKEQGIEFGAGNKLTPVLYAKLFSVFGFKQSFPLYVSLILYGISSILFFLLVLKLFNIKVALLFSFIEILSPIVLQRASAFGFYEWAFLFLTVAIFIYLYKEKQTSVLLFLAGTFFAFASLARNSVLVFLIPFLVYEFYKNKSLKRIIIFILPLLICWGIYLGPGMINPSSLDNPYLNSKQTNIGYLHTFPDSYTWYFEKDEYVRNFPGEEINYDYAQNLIKYGYPVSLKNRILMYWASIKSYPKGLFAQTTIGGPILVFFLFLGAFYLYKNKKDLLKLFFLWIVFFYLVLVFLKSNHWDHFLMIEFPLVLMSALGVYWSAEFLLKDNSGRLFKKLIMFLFVVFLGLHFVQSDKWTFHENYENSNAEQTFLLAKTIEKNENLLDKRKDIIAVGTYSGAPLILNYYTDYSFIYFDPATIEKLIKNNKLQWAFEQFGVTKIIGYDRELSSEISVKTNIQLLAQDMVN